MVRLASVLFGVVALLQVQVASGWAQLGHQLVGELAGRMLTPAARDEVAALLQGEPEPTLAGVAYWADALRANDPDRFQATLHWHYVSLEPETCRFEATGACPNGDCLVAAIKAQIQQLADRSAPLAARRDALKFLVHFMGDVHQPLHASNLPDKGGNAFPISLRTAIPPEAYARDKYVNGLMDTNLHAVWDYYVLASAKRSLQTYARQLRSSRHLRVPKPLDVANADPVKWVMQSCRTISDAALYPRLHVMDERYLKKMRPLAEQQVVTAARRLAQVLNSLFPAVGSME